MKNKFIKLFFIINFLFLLLFMGANIFTSKAYACSYCEKEQQKEVYTKECAEPVYEDLECYKYICWDNPDTGQQECGDGWTTCSTQVGCNYWRNVFNGYETVCVPDKNGQMCDADRDLYCDNGSCSGGPPAPPPTSDTPIPQQPVSHSCTIEDCNTDCSSCTGSWTWSQQECTCVMPTSVPIPTNPPEPSLPVSPSASQLPEIKSCRIEDCDYTCSDCLGTWRFSPNECTCVMPTSAPYPTSAPIPTDTPGQPYCSGVGQAENASQTMSCCPNLDAINGVCENRLPSCTSMGGNPYNNGIYISCCNGLEEREDERGRIRCISPGTTPITPTPGITCSLRPQSSSLLFRLFSFNQPENREPCIDANPLISPTPIQGVPHCPGICWSDQNCRTLIGQMAGHKNPYQGQTDCAGKSDGPFCCLYDDQLSITPEIVPYTPIPAPCGKQLKPESCKETAVCTAFGWACPDVSSTPAPTAPQVQCSAESFWDTASCSKRYCDQKSGIWKCEYSNNPCDLIKGVPICANGNKPICQPDRTWSCDYSTVPTLTPILPASPIPTPNCSAYGQGCKGGGSDDNCCDGLACQDWALGGRRCGFGQKVIASPTPVPTDVLNCGGWGAQCWGGGSNDTCCHSQGLSCQSIAGSRSFTCLSSGPVPTTTTSPPTPTSKTPTPTTSSSATPIPPTPTIMPSVTVTLPTATTVPTVTTAPGECHTCDFDGTCNSKRVGLNISCGTIGYLIGTCGPPNPCLNQSLPTNTPIPDKSPTPSPKPPPTTTSAPPVSPTPICDRTNIWLDCNVNQGRGCTKDGGTRNNGNDPACCNGCEKPVDNNKQWPTKCLPSSKCQVNTSQTGSVFSGPAQAVTTVVQSFQSAVTNIRDFIVRIFRFR